MLLLSLPICFLVIGAAICAPELVQNQAHEAPDSHAVQEFEESHVGPLEKRSPHYNFGLGKRAYTYVSEYKRLPVYNFGLGKRSRPYSFGLGKRSGEDAPSEETDVDHAALTELFDQYDDGTGYDMKRARPYSFGLGKRLADDESPEDKRAKMYDFGLGKRLPLYNFGLGKRARTYNFGLGKRLSSKFNFGLGKRERDMNRFSFGLGKRSIEDSLEDPDNYIDV